ncbi:hypothetical protein D3C87_1882530 [compost metagenome]
MACGRGRGRRGQFGHGGGSSLGRGGSLLHRRWYILLDHGAAALDDTDLALGFRDFEFGHIRLGDEVDEGFEFSQIHESSNG